MIWILVFPALIKEVIQVIPFLEFQSSFQLQLHDLEMFRYYVGLRRLSEFVNGVGGSIPECLAVLPSLQIVLELVWSVLFRQSLKAVEY